MANNNNYLSFNEINKKADDLHKKLVDFKNGMKSEEEVFIAIDGEPLLNFSDYSYVEVKSYFDEPQRSANGVIDNLNSYSTFLTPKLRINFKTMPIETYRILMRKIKEKNEFLVSVYDIVEDEVVTRKMYFYPKDYPQIYTHSLKVLALLDESFELVGTNASVEGISITYNSNPPYVNGILYLSFIDINVGDTFTVGDYDEDLAENPLNFTYPNYKLNNWNTKPDGKGIPYQTGETIQVTNSIILYAQWKSETEFTLSFDYQGAEANNSTLNKQVTQNQKIGSIPSGDTAPIKDGYIFKGWFTELNGKGTEFTSSTIFNENKNITLYAYWEGVTNTLSFNSSNGTGTMPSRAVKSGESIALPYSEFKKQGYEFIGWSLQPNPTEVDYKDNAQFVMPTNNVTLYAVYQKAYTLIYDYNLGTGEKSRADNIITLNTLIYPYKDNYNFIGWYFDKELKEIVKTPLTLEKDPTILYAKWVEVSNE